MRHNRDPNKKLPASGRTDAGIEEKKRKEAVPESLVFQAGVFRESYLWQTPCGVLYVVCRPAVDHRSDVYTIPGKYGQDMKEMQRNGKEAVKELWRENVYLYFIIYNIQSVKLTPVFI